VQFEFTVEQKKSTLRKEVNLMLRNKFAFAKFFWSPDTAKF
jgi:hypothetical protein